MKLRRGAAILLMAPGLAFAQVTVYGKIGLALRSVSHADPAGHSLSELNGTPLGAGIWGIRGNDVLTNDLKLRFRLEGGFQPDTGVLRYNGIVGREASLGLEGAWGQLDFGHLQHIGMAAETLIRADPLNGAGLFETVWPGIWTGARVDNAIRYRLLRGPWFASALLALGERTPTTAGRVHAWTAGYHLAPIMVMGAWQTWRDANSLSAVSWTVGATYPVGKATLHAAFMRARREQGFLIGASAGTALFSSELAFAGIPAPAPQDSRFSLLGLSLPLGGPWRLRTATFFSNSPHATLFSANRGGTQRSAYATLSYALSPSTTVLLSHDANRWAGGWAGFWGASAGSLSALRPDGRDSRRSTSLGMIHNF
jgi:predicted porin